MCGTCEKTDEVNAPQTVVSMSRLGIIPVRLKPTGKLSALMDELKTAAAQWLNTSELHKCARRTHEHELLRSESRDQVWPDDS